MTPPATAAARSVDRAAPGSRRGPGRHPRRISGPAGPARAAGVAAAVAIPAPGIALPRRRQSRPAIQPRRRPARRTRRPPRGAPGIALRVIDAFEGVSNGAVLDRLIRGRVWIGLLAFALIGIVAMQLLVLELNTGIARTLTRMAALQRQNAQLGIEDSTYSAEERIAPAAAAAGMILAPVGTVHFVTANPADVSRAAAALSTTVQVPTIGQAGSAGTEGGEAAGSVASSSGGTAEAAGSVASSSGGTAEAARSPESSTVTTGTGESATGSSQSSSVSAGSASSSPVRPSTTSSSGAGTRATGASAAPSSASAVSSTETSGSGGGTQAGPRE
jgi:hypothetical protein